MNRDKNSRSSFQDVRKAELSRIRDRRKQYLRPRLPALKCDQDSPPLTGLALSGGGIRSACFNLGLIEALDAQAVERVPQPERLKQSNGKRNGEGNGHGENLSPPKGDVRSLELFDYLSAVSGGSYVAGHLAMATLPSPSKEYDGTPPDTRLGELSFDTNSVPQWSWAVGVWFLGFVFQVLKTGSLLVAILGIIALIFRICDAPDVLRFCSAIGLNTDVRRGFVPFWLILFVTFISFLLRQRPQRAFLWKSVSLTAIAIYTITILSYHGLNYRTSATWHFLTILMVFGLGLLLVLKWPESSDAKVDTEPNKGFYLLPLLTALFCVAGLVTTGDIEVGTPAPGPGTPATQELSKILAQWGQRIFMSATAVLGITSLAFVRWRDLVRSTHQVAEHAADSRWRPVFQVIIFLCSYGLLLLLSFVLYGAVARENVSGYNERRKVFAERAFHRTDFTNWDKAWERIQDDAAQENFASPWHPLAAAILEACRSPKGDEQLTLPTELTISQQIKALEARPWLTRWLPPTLKRSRTFRLSDWLSASRLYDLQLELNEIQETVASRLATKVLGQQDLYRKVSHVPQSAIAPIKAKPAPASSLEDLTPREEYLRTARYLANLKTADDALKAAIRQNNRRALRLYLGDLMRDNDAKGNEIFASVVWFEDQLARLRIIGLALITWLLCSLIDQDSNQFSLHIFYRDHIRKQWLRRWRGANGTGWLCDDLLHVYRSGRPRLDRIPGTAVHDDAGTSPATLRRAPFLLINATISEGSRSLGNDPNLSLNIFTFSPIAAGSHATGYWLGKRNTDFTRKNRLDISQMVAVSGAFLSPGQVANPTLAAIFHVLNIQTGWWVSNPAVRESFLQELEFHFWQSLGLDRKDDNHYLLTDGAHVENLGLKVLFDRRCSLIVASDCSQESDLGHPFCALIEVLRQARLDGIRIGPFLSSRGFRHWLETGEIDETTLKQEAAGCRRPLWQGLDLVNTPTARKKPTKSSKAQPEAASPSPAGANDGSNNSEIEASRTENPRLAQEHFLFAHVEYPAQGSNPALEGLLIYLRPTLTGDEGESLVRPGFAGAHFPNDPPLDQFYNVARMNSYRLLGRHIGHELTQNRIFQVAMDRVIRGQSPVPPRPYADQAQKDSCSDCGKTGKRACRAHVDSAFRTATAP